MLVEDYALEPGVSPVKHKFGTVVYMYVQPLYIAICKCTVVPLQTLHYRRGCHVFTSQQEMML